MERVVQIAALVIFALVLIIRFDDVKAGLIIIAIALFAMPIVVGFAFYGTRVILDNEKKYLVLKKWRFYFIHQRKILSSSLTAISINATKIIGKKWYVWEGYVDAWQLSVWLESNGEVTIAKSKNQDELYLFKTAIEKSAGKTLIDFSGRKRPVLAPDIPMNDTVLHEFKVRVDHGMRKYEDADCIITPSHIMIKTQEPIILPLSWIKNCTPMYLNEVPSVQLTDVAVLTYLDDSNERRNLSLTLFDRTYLTLRDVIVEHQRKGEGVLDNNKGPFIRGHRR